MRAGAAKPNIGTPGALKQTLQKAKSISFASEGASRVYLEKMFDQFGIASEMKTKTVLTPSSVKSNELVRDGKAEYILTLVSEILPAAPGVELVGPLPGDVQSYVNFAAGVRVFEERSGGLGFPGEGTGGSLNASKKTHRRQDRRRYGRRKTDSSFKSFS
jgi:molybdate transport system substrate-binding protein